MRPRSLVVFLGVVLVAACGARGELDVTTQGGAGGTGGIQGSVSSAVSSTGVSSASSSGTSTSSSSSSASSSSSSSSSSSGGCVPSAEICDGLDNDCNGIVDDGNACLGCPTASHGGHFYAFCQDHRSWPEALAACNSIGMSLLSIDGAAEEDWVYGVESGFSTEKAWMGLSDQDHEGTFVWVNGDPVAYTDWEPGEPNGGTGENCGQINRYYPDHGWNDEPCDFQLHFICESP